MNAIYVRISSFSISTKYQLQMSEPSLYELIKKYEALVLELETDNRELRRELQYLKDRIQSGQTQEDSNNPTTSA